MSSAGRAVSSNGCFTKPKEREIGLTGCAVSIRSSSLTGSYVMETAEHREPYESRGSRTVLGAPGGETPPGDSTITPVPARGGRVRMAPVRVVFAVPRNRCDGPLHLTRQLTVKPTVLVPCDKLASIYQWAMLRLGVHLREYSVRLAEPGDEARLQALLESDPDYFKVIQGAPPRSTEAKDQLSDLPEGKKYDDKFVYAIFDRDDALAALIDLVRAYPDAETWFLGLVFVAPAS